MRTESSHFSLPEKNLDGKGEKFHIEFDIYVDAEMRSHSQFKALKKHRCIYVNTQHAW